MVAVEWVVLVNRTEVGCTGLLGPETNQKFRIQNKITKGHTLAKNQPMLNL